MTANLLLAALLLYFLGGLGALLASRRPKFALYLGAAGATAGGATGAFSALLALGGAPLSAATLPWTILGERLTLSVDSLSAVFLLPIFLLSALFSIYGIEYLAHDAGKKPLGVQALFYNLLSLSMAVVVTARNGALLLVGWEVMALASFFLVAYDHEKAEVREASWIYLIATHLGGLLLIAFFALLADSTGSMDLDPMVARELPAATTTLLFLLGLVGFGAKAGFWPLHVWLPKAHPAAPSHVSALMSGVMVKTGIYGICRMIWLFGAAQAWWGILLIVIGVFSGVSGSLFALGQRDIKALLAYCTVENVGIILLGLGVGLLGSSWGFTMVAAAGYAGALLHVWNHALFKGLLFLGAGSVAHGTGQRDMEQLGGLMKSMPRTGWLFLAGSAAICALPPFNGLISEWLIFLGLFRAGAGIEGWLGLAPLVGVAGLALMGGLALAGFAKAFGIVFLGAPREIDPADVHESGGLMLWPMTLLALACLAIGLMPGFFVGYLAGPVSLLDHGAGSGVTGLSDFTAPLAKVGYVSAGVLGVALLLLLVRKKLLAGREVGASPTWDCGYGAPSTRMQYSGSSFSSPTTNMFGSLIKVDLSLTSPEGYFPGEGALKAKLSDSANALVWEPVFAGTTRALARLRFIQAGKLQHYLLVIFLTLLGLLAWALIPG